MKSARTKSGKGMISILMMTGHRRNGKRNGLLAAAKSAIPEVRFRGASGVS